MKKIFLLISVFWTAQSVQAGKYFDYDEKTQTCFFKKSGKKFETAVGNLCIFNKPIKEIKFHENVAVKQKAKVLNMLGFSALPLIADLSKNSSDLEKDLSLFSKMGLLSQMKSLSLQKDNDPENVYNFMRWGFCKNRQEAKNDMERVTIKDDGLMIRDPEIFLKYVKHATNLESLNIRGITALSKLVKDDQSEAFRNEFYNKLNDEEFWEKFTKLEKFENLEIKSLTYTKKNFWEIQRKAKSKRDNFWNLLSENLKEKKLTRLYLHDLRNAFYPENLESLGNSLKGMDSLKCINLGDIFHSGDEGDEGITHLADILSSLKNIQEIHIDNIGFTEKAASQILKKLKGKQELRRVSMCSNSINANLSDLFYDIMEECQKLTEIALSGSHVQWSKSSEREKKLINDGWSYCYASTWVKKNK